VSTPIPDNRARFTLLEVAKATGGALTNADGDAVVEGITTDSRGGAAGKLFVALVGERFDGHAFIDGAVESGARAVLVKRGAAVLSGVAAIEVDDTLGALGTLGRAHRKRWGGTVVAIGGSAGKTTTKSAVAAALEAVAPGAVHAVKGNLNNLIGVPMVLFGLEATHRLAVVEIGTNTHGEVGKLAALVEPNVGVLTLVDVEHSEGLGSIDEIEEEEGALFRALPKTGVAIANGDDERAVRQLLRATAKKKIAYGTRGAADYRVLRREGIGIGGSRVTIERPRGRGRETIALDVPLLGRPGALSVAAAVAVADRVAGRSVPKERLAAALSASALGEPGRLRPVELLDHTVVLDDSYNANPASVRAAVATAREIADDRGARLVLVLGEMRELGNEAVPQHERVGRDIGESGAAVLVAVGGEAARFVAPAAAQGVDAAFADDAEHAAGEVLRRIRPGDVVLVKASRGVHVEHVVEELIRVKGRAA
jgi:UDP-N-acetylmuramoyl-tripeptide--D-alanyl-D-alanine ligase